MKKTLIVFYSWHGNIRKIAELIAEQTEGTLLELQPVVSYPTNYRACVDQAEGEVRNEYKPELKNLPNNIDEYDAIFLGSPIWWHTMAPPMATFIDTFDLSGKTVAPFYSHGGSGSGTYERDMTAACKDSKVMEVFGTFNVGGRDIASQIKGWIKSLEL